MASTSSTRVPSTAPTYWNVFLSFRGIDTRTGFTSHLYDGLACNGIHTFMDDPELHSGEIISSALLDAIQKSKIYIIVLSENYASSTWCLDELVEKCFKELGRLVIPVFYKIDPSVVRHQIGSFKAAFERHEKVRFVQKDKLNEWRLALSQVADFSGHHVDQTISEVHIKNKVVDAVLREIEPRTINVAKYPVGIDYRVEEMTPLFTTGTQGVHYIGIWGMGGVGKTTLAKAAYNANLGSFQGSCFLANVTDVSRQPNGLQGLQAQLIADVLNVKKPKIDSTDKGIELIKERICSKKVLIVVDDLNDPKQLDYLVVASFASGSVIILTTRHEDLLISVGVEATCRHMLNELDDAHSRELFNKYAFKDEKPSHAFVVLSEEILHHARGLPLALEIFGSTLCNQSEEQWRRFIGQLKKVVNPKIQEKLVISFESLADCTLKEMLLDIACFFVGNYVEDVVHILRSCYENVDANIDHLKSRCLIKIDEKNKFSMHDLVRDMGWEIARQSSGKDDLEKHSRISGWENIYNVLDYNMGTKAIKGMVHHYGYYESYKETFDTETFKSMPKLRFLKMKNVNLTGSFERIFKDLTWFHWSHCPLESIPSDFYPKKLAILELPDSQIIRWKLSKDLKNLKILDLSDSHKLLTTPDFCRLPCLETIKLCRCINLEKVDTTIGDLKNLVSLDLKGCCNLPRLPDSVCKLTALENLDIGDCHGLEALPEELGNMKSLTRLVVGSEDNVVGSKYISKLPDSMRCLTKLVELRLHAQKLETLGDTISYLRSLEILDISECWEIVELLPYSNSQMLNLQLPRNLKQLRATCCKSVLGMPDLSMLKYLEILDLTDCTGLTEIQGLEKLTSIREFEFRRCTSIERLPNISNLKLLDRLDLRDCVSLIEIEGLEELTSIRDINLNGCRSMKSLPNLSNLKILEELKLNSCRHLVEIEGLEELILVRELGLQGCKSLERLPNLSNFKHLETLCLKKCTNLKEIEGLEGLASIRQLDLVGCSKTMVANTLTERLFQMYSELGNLIKIQVDKGDSPNWMSHLSLGCTEVRTNYLSHDFLGLLLSVDCLGDLDEEDRKLPFVHKYNYTIDDETANGMVSKGKLMVIVPFMESSGSCDEEYDIFQVTASCDWHKESDVKIGVHPLYKLPQKSYVSTHAKEKKRRVTKWDVEIGVHPLYDLPQTSDASILGKRKADLFRSHSC